MSHGAKAKQQGVALAIVVWFIAGMSLLVASIVSQATVDTRLAQLHVAKAEAAAAGDGAIQLMLAQRMFDPTSAGGQSANLEGEFRQHKCDPEPRRDMGSVRIRRMRGPGQPPGYF